MVRKQVYLTASQNLRLRRAARKLQRSEAALLREAVERYLPDSESGHGDVQEDPLFRIVGVGEGASDLSERVDDVLYGSGA